MGVGKAFCCLHVFRYDETEKDEVGFGEAPHKRVLCIQPTSKTLNGGISQVRELGFAWDDKTNGMRPNVVRGR